MIVLAPYASLLMLCSNALAATRVDLARYLDLIKLAKWRHRASLAISVDSNDCRGSATENAIHASRLLITRVPV